MPLPIILPKFGFTLETAEIVRWLVVEGDAVRAGDPLCEVTTDKVNMEVEAPEAGTVYAFQYPQGAVVPVTAVICYLARPGEAALAPPPAEGIDQPVAEALSTGDYPNPMPQSAVTPLAKRVAEAHGVDLTGVQGSGRQGRITRRDVEGGIASGKVRATPAARRLAREQNIDLAEIAHRGGTGVRGRVQGADVQRYVDAAAQSSAVQNSLQNGGAIREVKIAGMRRTIANRLQKSFQTAPHVFFDAQIAMNGIETLRATLKGRGEKLSVTAIIMKACASALLRHPYLNATTDGETIFLHSTANIGMAVAVEGGLVVPVIPHVEGCSLREVQARIDALTERARTNTLHLNDVREGTFTVSNLGMYGVDRFTAIINPPQVAILAVGRTQRLFAPDERDQPVLKSFLMVTLSVDHRVVDGAVAAQFLSDLRGVLETPALLAW
ncbi:MAG TPA: dihydrolipoamide acetyltransferase family protein [Aggregatilineales bacterium]|nr:2-oxo acid dehydrogenase subunit E2 [Anaerolineales bacterium]HRE48872.1 dihydrolipoamide acetyltransferase family protein [Aggregatilineales bacterium]